MTRSGRGFMNPPTPRLKYACAEFVAERLDLSLFHASDAVKGSQLYRSSLLVKVWLYG
ncbi:MAG: hypothetical protein ABR956_07650 [Terracidiphilus sp.]|jgi:hypothetical protein